MEIIRKTFVIGTVLSIVLSTAKVAHSSTGRKSAAEDPQEVASSYARDAADAKVKMEYAESLMVRWENVENMAERTKVPNPYSHAKALAESYRARIERDNRLISEYLKTAGVARAEKTF